MKTLIFAGVILVTLSVQICFGQINTTKLNELMKKAEDTHSEAVIIYKDNKLIAEKYFGVGNRNKKTETMSCTKSIVGLAVACMLTDKLIDSLDIPVSHYYPEWKQGQKRQITIRHLVNMTSGIQNVPNTGIEIYPSPDFVQLALTAELSNKPGEVWSYNNKSLNLMAGIIKKITGKRMDVYIGERLFKPLGITDFTWSLDSVGNPHVMSGCQIKPIDFAKIGLVLLNKGKFNGNQVIAEEYIHDVITPCAKNKQYGMLWWLGYEQDFSIVDDEIIQTLKDAKLSEDFIKKAELTKGRYSTNLEYLAKVQSVFGNNPWQYISDIITPNNLRMRRREFGGNMIYTANGYLGNYIIVNPAAHVVAIRMISHESFKSENDNFGEFANMVNVLNK